MHPRWIPQPSSETIRKSAKLPDFTCKSSLRMKCRLVDGMRIKKHEAVEEWDISWKLNISEIWFRWSFINITLTDLSRTWLITPYERERMMFTDIPVTRLQACEVFTCASGKSSSGRRVGVATFWGHHVCVSWHIGGGDVGQGEDDEDAHLVHLWSHQKITRTLAWSHELDLHLLR